MQTHVTKNSLMLNEQACTGTLVPRVMATLTATLNLCWQRQRAQKALLILGTSKNVRKLQLIRDSGGDKQLAD